MTKSWRYYKNLKDFRLLKKRWGLEAQKRHPCFPVAWYHVEPQWTCVLSLWLCLSLVLSLFPTRVLCWRVHLCKGCLVFKRSMSAVWDETHLKLLFTSAATCVDSRAERRGSQTGRTDTSCHQRWHRWKTQRGKWDFLIISSYLL